MRAINVKTLILDKKLDILLIALVIVFSFTVRYAGLMDSGITWDEPLTIMAGMKYGHDIETLNFNSSAWTLDNEHGPVSKYIYGLSLGLLGHRTLDYQTFVISKTVAVIMGVLSCVLVYLFCREFYDSHVAFGAAVVLALIPTFVAHSQQAAVDNPLTLFFTLTLLLFILAARYHNKYLYAASAVSMGLLIDTKFNGLLVIPVLVLFYWLYIYYENGTLQRTGQNKAVDKPLKDYLPIVSAIIFFSLAMLTVYIAWPWLWPDPIGHMNISLSHWTYTPIEYFMGSAQKATPIYYVAYFLVTTPVLLFVPLAFGVYRSARSKNAYKLAVLLWLIVPFAYSFSSFIQDGMRYLLMIYPAMAILVADGLDGIASRAGSLNMGLSKNILYAGLVALAIMYLLYALISVHPYYLDYYNVLAGGPSNVQEHKLFKFGWWGEGIYDSVAYIEKNATRGTTVYVATQPNDMVRYYATSNLYTIPNASLLNETIPSQYDYIITNEYAEEYYTLRFNASDYTLVHTTSVGGAPLVSVYHRKQAA
jgi:4-amino-4-deoxy-L-arabinose transferase-like glycosyltransferase